MPQGPGNLKNHRLHALCPYFAMFPPTFAREVILNTTEPGDLVLDPFSGRGTTILEALLNGRRGIACDINPVAATISAAKSRPPSLDSVLERIMLLGLAFTGASRRSLEREASALPEFFQHAFHFDTLLQILFLRRNLVEGRTKRDTFIAALCMGHLHGESNRSPNYFSNQMAHTIAMKPGYAIGYWNEHELRAPTRNVFEILFDKACFRLGMDVPEQEGVVKRTDVRRAGSTFLKFRGEVAAAVTSPPYLDVTSFEEDQWLRLWFLGGEPRPTYGLISKDDRHNSPVRYFEFLRQAWNGIAPLLKRKAVITCRIAAKRITPTELAVRLVESLQAAWPKGALIAAPTETNLVNRQTVTFLPGATGCVKEYDFVFATA